MLDLKVLVVDFGGGFVRLVGSAPFVDSTQQQTKSRLTHSPAELPPQEGCAGSGYVQGMSQDMCKVRGGDCDIDRWGWLFAVREEFTVRGSALWCLLSLSVTNKLILFEDL